MHSGGKTETIQYNCKELSWYLSNTIGGEMATQQLTGRIGQVMAHVRTQIGNRTLVAGARLLSVRAQAAFRF